MKNLFFVLLLMTAFSFNSDAQNLDYWLYNSSTTATWNFAMDDAGPTPPVYELGMTPSSLTTGTLSPLFTLPLEWKAADDNGCYVTGVIASAPANGSALTTCGTTVYYKIQQAGPFSYQMKFDFP